MNDSLTICPKCNSNACYEIKQNDLTSYLCFGCGYSTTSQQTFSNKKFKIVEVEASMAELHKDLRWIDKNTGYVWYPSTINQSEKGIVFADGNSKDNWRWSAMKSSEILEEEKDKFPKNQKYKIDKKTLKQFDRLDFIDALDHIGYFR